MRRSVAPLLALASLLLSACQHAGISGAGMMRVEVEVYKGPIGKSKESQIGELSALLAETVKAMNGWRRQALLVASDQVVSPRAADPLHCASKVGDPDCAILDQAISAAAEVAAAICNIDPEGYRLEVYYRPASPADATGKTLDQAGAEQWSRMQYGDACKALLQGAQGNAYLADTRIDGPPAMGTIKSGFREYTRRVSTVASIMRAKAYRLVSANTGYVPKNQQVRYMSASLGYMLTEFANSIANRTSILQKGFPSCDEKANTVSDADHGKRPDEDQSQDPQAKCERTLEADKLPTGDYLGDVEVSRFIDVYRWMNAANPSLGTGAYRRDDRIAAIRSLTEDYYWEKVNEVYASGQGDVSMAFIKDELGNWNLKSYTNDPAKLLAAYRQGANALIASAVDVARKASGDPVNLAKGAGLLDLADRFATGKSRQGPAMGGLNVAALHTRTLERLTALRSRFKERADQLEQLKISLTNSATIAETDWGAAVAARQSAESEEAAAKAALAACTAGCATETTRLADALAATQANRTVVAAAESKLRDERAKLALATAQADQLGSLAAEEVARDLEEHQGDLAAIQVSITSPPGPGAPKP